MATVSVTQNSFTGGEWAPILRSRVNLEKYQTACRIMKNFIPLIHGAAMNRGGTGFTCEVKDSTKRVRLIPFVFSLEEGQAYHLEFGDYYMRVIQAGGNQVIYSPGKGTDIVVASTYKWTASTHGTGTYYLTLTSGLSTSLARPKAVYSDIGGSNTRLDELKDIESLTSGSWGWGDVDSLGFNTIYIRLSDGSDPDSKTDGYLEASYPVEIATPWSVADLPILKFEQSSDVVYLWNPSYQERKLSRLDHDDWSYEIPTYSASILPPSGVSKTSGSGSGSTIGVTAINEIGEESILSSTINVGSGDVIGWTAVTDATSYKVYLNVNDIYQQVGTAGATSWKVPTTMTPDDTVSPPTFRNPFDSVGNYPGCGCFHEQRLVRARTNKKVQTVWSSRTASYENLNKSSPVKDDDAYTFTMYNRMQSEIRWIVSLNTLIIGTSEKEWRMQAGGNTNSITPTSVDNKVQSAWGVAHIPPIIHGDSVLFVDSSYKSIRNLFYSLEKDGYDGDDLCIQSWHFFEDAEIVEWAYQKRPYQCIWLVLSDGRLISLTYFKKENVAGLAQHTTNGSFESVSCIPINGGKSYEVSLVVRREIGGATKRYIERFRDRLPTKDVADAYFVDCGLTYEGDSTNTVSGLDHLEGESVVALVDGDYVGNLVVENGVVVLPVYGEKIHIGFPYECELAPYSFEYQTQTGSVQDKKRQIKSALIEFYKTNHAYVGQIDSQRMEEVLFRKDEKWGDATGIYTGSKEITLPATGNLYGGTVVIKTTKPLPCTVLAITARIENGEN